MMNNLSSTSVFVASILATFYLILSKEEAVIDGPPRSSAVDEEDDIPPPSPPRIPRRVLPVVQEIGDVDDDDDDDNNNDDDDDNDYDSGDDGEDEEDTSDEGSYDYEDSDDSNAAAAMSAYSRSVFSDTLADKFQSQMVDIAMTITLMKQIMEYASSQGARSLSFQGHYIVSSHTQLPHKVTRATPESQLVLSGCLQIILDGEEKDGSETDCAAWNDCSDIDGLNGELRRLYNNPPLSYSSFLLGEFDSHAKDLASALIGPSNVTLCSGVGLTLSRITVTTKAIKIIEGVIPMAKKEEKKWKMICYLILSSNFLNSTATNAIPQRSRRERSDAVLLVELQNVAARSSEVNSDPNLLDFWSKVLAIAEKNAVEICSVATNPTHWARGGNVTISSEQISAALNSAYTLYVKNQLEILRVYQNEAPLTSTQLLPLQQSISNEDVQIILRHLQRMYCWKKILYVLRKDGFNAHASILPRKRHLSNDDGTCSKFTIDLWNPLSKADRLSIDWSTYEEELKKHYGFCFPSIISSRNDFDEDDSS